MRVLVAGIDGYVGAILCPTLVERGFDVVGIDCGFYRDGWIYNDGCPRPPTFIKDVRGIATTDVRGFDAIVHLAEQSNDPLGELSERTTCGINHVGSITLARACKEAGVPRFIYTSSCSAYGAAEDEGSVTNDRRLIRKPRCQMQGVGRTRCWRARRLPFLSSVFAQHNGVRRPPAHALRHRSQQSRRFCLDHERDEDDQRWHAVAPAGSRRRHLSSNCAVSEAPREAVPNEIFNVGDNRQNYRIREIAAIVGQAFDDCAITFGTPSGDNRSYRTTFDKIHHHLRGIPVSVAG